jgi:glucose-1-phosphate thymidylyltransferase
MAHKGIILGGGTGTRLWPMTLAVNKHLLPVHDKPMIYYPLSTLIGAGIQDILLISTPQDLPLYQTLLADGSQWGISIQYAIQDQPKGIAQAFLIGESFIGNDNVTLILGDNIFYGSQISQTIHNALSKKNGATIFPYYVNDPQRYGVVTFDKENKPISIEEKPANPQSNYAVTGLYCFDNNVIEISKHLQPSARGELEVTDINKHYLKEGLLHAEILSRGIAWLDTGTPSSLLDAAHFIHTIEARQGLKVGCPEEVAWRMGYINNEKLELAAKRYSKNDYGQYLLGLLTH